MRKRLLAIIATVAMVAAMVPSMVFAAPSGQVVDSADKLKTILTEGNDNITIVLAEGVNYGKVSLTDINTLPMNVKIVGNASAKIEIENGSGASPNYNRNNVVGWTFENVVFTGKGMYFYNNYVGGDGVDVKNLTLKNCTFEEGANLIVSGDKHENIVIDGCKFNNTDLSATSSSGNSAVMIYGSNGVTIKGCAFTNPGYNAIQLAKNMTGKIDIQNNVIKGTKNRAMRIVTIPGAAMAIKNNEINDAANTSGEFIKIDVADGTTVEFAGNTFNGKGVKVKEATTGELIYTRDDVCDNHAWDEAVVTTAPTVDAEGVKTYTCENCGVTKTEAIAKLPATPEAKPAAKPEASPNTGDNSMAPFAVAGLVLAAMAAVVATRRRAS